MMDNFPHLKPLIKKHWDSVRDLNKVMVSDLCKSNRIGLEQMCIVDNDEKKLQTCKENTILADEYTTEDVMGQSFTGKAVRDDAWHRAYMERLTGIVLHMLDTCDNVQMHLAMQLAEEFKPRDLVPEAKARFDQIEQEKREFAETLDYESFYTGFPEDFPFKLFKEIPKDIMAEFTYKNLDFMLAKFKHKNKICYKFFTMYHRDFPFFERLLKQKGYLKMK